jgi:hypothetical protein
MFDRRFQNLIYPHGRIGCITAERFEVQTAEVMIDVSDPEMFTTHVAPRKAVREQSLSGMKAGDPDSVNKRRGPHTPA